MRSLPYFSRAQQGVILLLGAALLLLWAWRANFWLAPSPPPAKTLNFVFIEVTGAAAHPGVYSFDHPPTLAEVYCRAGAAVPPPGGEKRLASGSLLNLNQDGSYQLSRMGGPQLLTLGLSLDLNRATAADLEALPDIGPVMAGRIIAYRQTHGPFNKIADLMEISGIGPQNLEKLKPYLALGSPEASPPAPAAKQGMTAEKPPPAASQEAGGEEHGRLRSRRAAKPKPPARPLDPNLATQADLEALPGIGPVLAKRIIAYRTAHGPFKKIGDLEKVSGIGPKKLEKIEPYLFIEQKKD